MYELSNVTKNYLNGRRTVTAVRDLNLVIGDGEWLAIQGRTGHGKSTLLHILGALDRPSTGTVTLAGQDLTQLREAQVTRLRAESIGFIFQTFNLVPTLSAAENVESALIPLGTRSGRRRRLVADALESVGLSDRARHLPSQLSGGQQRRDHHEDSLVAGPWTLCATVTESPQTLVFPLGPPLVVAVADGLGGHLGVRWPAPWWRAGSRRSGPCWTARTGPGGAQRMQR